MDSHSDKLPGLNLPPLSSGQNIVSSSAQGVPSTMPPITPIAAAPVHPSAATVHPSELQPQAVQSAAAPIAPDDRSDGLDEEWVNKAKMIVEETKNDPYIESSKLSRVKADYLNIRYNKHIKVAEDHT